MSALDAERRQALRQLAHDLDPLVREPRERHQRDRGRDHDQHDGASAQQALAEHEHAERAETEQQRGKVDRAELADELRDAREEVVAGGRDAKEFRELRRSDHERRADLEAHQHRLGDELHDAAQPEEPGERGDRGHEQRREGGVRGVALGIARGERPERRSHQHRDRRSWTDRELARAAEERVGGAAEQVAVEARLRWQSGE